MDATDEGSKVFKDCPAHAARAFSGPNDRDGTRGKESV
jgi:hypothetical protein